MNAVQTKDHLIEMIDAAITKSEIVVMTNTILTILEHTEGFWKELNYCYKAKEIAERLDYKLMYLCDDAEKHRLRMRVIKQVAKYHDLQAN